ncbi:DUF4184 domain-containing protein [Streptomyces tateyamensis]|uniref:DUF4184 domain-containing protein n=1 Tax=Streptomyces tateyamensis TaxID=565073 RepID=A0A2V4NCK1_9ACTN|nr:DUF4184 family protein [Streptomyces tateyamensis]PYC82145.1 DUF4184 domain-containing protein [Streptomyces tateyamensis]
MPFTFSHPAAVLPLLRGLRGRGPLVAAGLVAGSMAPDLPFFAASCRGGLYRHGALTHRWWAVPTVDVALAGALVAGWESVLRRPLLGLLPPRWAGPALAATAPGPRPATAAGFALSAAIGAATHVGWDAFTHPGRAGTRLLPVLQREAAGVPLATVAQYASSAVALGVLARHLGRELGGPEPAAHPAPDPHPAPEAAVPPPGRAARRAVVLLATAAGAAHRVARARQVRGGRPSLIADLCFGGGAGAVAGTALLALADRAAQRRYRPAEFG